MDEAKERIKSYLEIYNPNISEDYEEDLIDLVIDEVIDRVQLYLNSETIPKEVERIIAKIINTSLKKCSNEQESNDQAINSISDNGQSISYANEITKYFTTSSDEEIFSGFSSLLSRYRRIKVVYPKSNEEENS